MPLIKSGSQSAVSENIRREMDAGRKQSQAVAIALDIQRRARAGKYQDGGYTDDGWNNMDFNRGRMLPLLPQGGGGHWQGPASVAGALAGGAYGKYRQVQDRHAIMSLPTATHEHSGAHASRFVSGRDQDYGMPVGDEYAAGGMPWYARNEARDMGRYGFIHGANPGRSDTVPTKVRGQSYVVPADIVSALGQGNSLAGARRLDGISNRVPMPHPQKTPHPMPKFAGGGGVDIHVSDGEYIFSPDEVAHVGDGDIERGHQVLDNLVMRVRNDYRNHLSRLPPPKGSQQSQQFEDGGEIRPRVGPPSPMRWKMGTSVVDKLNIAGLLAEQVKEEGAREGLNSHVLDFMADLSHGRRSQKPSWYNPPGYNDGGMTHQGMQLSPMDRIRGGFRSYLDMMGPRKTMYQEGGDVDPMEEVQVDLPQAPPEDNALMQLIRQKNEAVRGYGFNPSYAPRFLGIRNRPQQSSPFDYAS